MLSCVNSLVLVRCVSNSKLIKQNSSLSTRCEIALVWMLENLSDEKSVLVQIIAWCRLVPSHYLYRWWPRSQSPHDVTMPQWVKWEPCFTVSMLISIIHVLKDVNLIDCFHKSVIHIKPSHLTNQASDPCPHQWFTRKIVACWKSLAPHLVWQVDAYCICG